jgi:disulfide bond formation protein DsbB
MSAFNVQEFAVNLHDALAILAVVALIGAVLMVVARLTSTVAGFRFLDALHRVQLPLAAIVAVVATTGSLWFSEGAGWVPCRFCWFQRIFMYSLAVILTVAAFRRDRGVKWFAAPLAIVGMCISVWHHLIERRVLEESSVCTSFTSCRNAYHESFGSIGFDSFTGVFDITGVPFTLAVMAFSGFAAILALLLAPEPLDLLEEEEDGQPSAG